MLLYISTGCVDNFTRNLTKRQQVYAINHYVVLSTVANLIYVKQLHMHCL